MSLVKATELRQKRGPIAEQMKALLANAKGENGALDAEQRTAFERMEKDCDALLASAKAIESHEALQAELAASSGTVAAKRSADPEKPEAAATKRAFESYLRFGFNGISAEDRAIMSGRAVQLEGRAMGTNVDTAGGFIVPDEFRPAVIEAQLAFGGMREAKTTKITTASGADLWIPTSNDTANSGVLVGENNAHTTQDITVAQSKLGAYLWSSKIVKVSLQLIQDAAIDVGSFVARQLGTRLGRVQNTYFTSSGTGASMPYSLASTASSGVAGATGQTTTVIYNNLVDLVHSVPRAYRSGAQWMFNDGTLAILRKIKDGNGNPIWQPGLTAGAPDRLAGYEYIINDDVAAMSASAKSVFFGQWQNYWIRDVQGTILLRLEELYAANLQVGFLAFSRADGNLIDAGTHPIKYYANSAS